MKKLHLTMKKIIVFMEKNKEEKSYEPFFNKVAYDILTLKNTDKDEE